MEGVDNELLEAFVQESREHLDTLEPDLLTLETDPANEEVINRIFRAVHSLKGAAGFFGLDKIAGLSHIMENLMSLVRDGEMEATKSVVDPLLAGSDKLRIMVEDLDNSGSVDTSEEIKRLKIVLGEEVAEGVASEGEAQAEEVPELERFRGKFLPDDYLIKDSIKEGLSFYIVTLDLKNDIEGRDRTIMDFMKEIDPLGYLLGVATDSSEIKGLSSALEGGLKTSLFLGSHMMPDLVVGAFGVKDGEVEQVSLEEIEDWMKGSENRSKAVEKSLKLIENKRQERDDQLKALEAQIMNQANEPEKPKTPAKEKKAEPAPAKKAQETIRIPVSLLDDLMNLAGEMVLSRNQLVRVASAGFDSENVENLTSVVHDISSVTTDLQEKVMQTRLQPIGTIFSKFVRIVRDLSTKLGKDINLDLEGEGVELDKSIVESLSDPLTHLIRNCADHAIETPQERMEVGKPGEGTVKLTAKHVGGQVHILIDDDGRGIDPVKIREKVLSKGLITEKQADEMSDQQMQEMIFAAGFSTAEQVSDVSGRGVGMDVVKTNIEKLGGSIDLTSEVGKGTRICLRVPLTLAIIPAMIIGSRNNRFAVPQINLEEIVMLGKERKVEFVQNSAVLRLRGNLLPLASLDALLDGNRDQEDVWSEDTTGFVMVLKVDQDRFGLVVDDLVGNEEIVVKPLCPYMKNIMCYSGSTIMGDGKVAMILDAAGLATWGKVSFGLSDNKHEAKVDNGVVGEKQSLLLFNNAASERYAINLSLISRIEKVAIKDIEHVGGHEYIKTQNNSLRLVRLDEFMDVESPKSVREYVYALIPKLVTHPMAIVAHELEDVMDATVKLDEKTIHGAGVLGSAIIDEKLTLFIDLYSLFEKVAPEHFTFAQGEKLKGKKVLLAEDTPFFRTVVERYLREIHCEVETVNHGQAAWDRLNECDEYDLLLTDIEMPIMNGLELSKKVKTSEKFKDLPIVALTSSTSSKYRKKGLDIGIDSYEQKLNKKELKATLERILA